ncbi:helix-turn-helix domain-containing protein [Clostridium beijerinckii]|uniref:helix-turn-helix domain-containing protein n=1 Tax=Clostridium beijerinckii TaxID=1520 RepID=UPI002226C945|nr:helix-turn-helix transcriptional regulator [Clostridium beijerinckii]UYZ37296.1 helix-turn-helix domain-containing protein [Clostridium beijerinckii]
MNEISSLGKNIKLIRVVNNIDRSKLSNLTGIEQLTLYEIECGDIQTLSEDDIEKIAKALNINIEILNRRI